TVAELVHEAERRGESGEVQAAIALYQTLLGRRPELPDCWYNLGRWQRRARQFGAALESYRQALERGVRAPEEVHLNRAVILTDYLRQDAAAEAELRRALELNPGYLPALLNLANLQTDRGQRDSARETYQRILELEPRAFEALARYAQLADFTKTDPAMIARLRTALADPGVSAAERASLGFALSRALDADGDYPEAFRIATRANADSRASVQPPPSYDRAGMESLVDALIATFPAAASTSTAPQEGPQPIFICGMYRSGSTLTERLLAGARGVATGGELDLLPQVVQSRLPRFPQSFSTTPAELLVEMARAYLEPLRRLCPQAQWVTDKRPENFLYLGLIKCLFPQARIVHTERNPLDTCLSIYFTHLDPAVSYALDLSDIGHYFRQYQRLMGHWQGLYGPDIHSLNYDRLVAEPRVTAQSLFDYCGIAWDESCLDFASRPASVKTASVWQVRRELHQGSSGRWRHYAAELRELAHEFQLPPPR
ncbi:MAG: sulfotransferase, partial [Sinobacteraceae bacterium]|nr:sulfotransferase [Nevskiaceae bacterium]